jgi:hypothetical protein
MDQKQTKKRKKKKVKILRKEDFLKELIDLWVFLE